MAEALIDRILEADKALAPDVPESRLEQSFRLSRALRSEAWLKNDHPLRDIALDAFIRAMAG